jgi:hypothetical protein
MRDSPPRPDERALPADVNAERATLGSCLLDRDAIIAIASWLTPDMFYLEKHAWIYEAILYCYRQRVPPDISTVSNELRRHDRLNSLGGTLYLGDISAEVPVATHVEYYARIVQRTYTMRRLIETGGQISCLGYDERAELDQVFEQAQAALEQIDRRREAPRGIPAPDLVKKPVLPVRWIIPKLISEGFGYIAAKPGTGKTWMLLQWAVALASGGRVFGSIQVEKRTVLFLALEDSEASLQERIKMVCKTDGHVPENLILYTEDDGWKALDDGGLLQLENAILEHEPALVIIDTLTAVAPDIPRGSNPYKGEYRSFIPVRHLADRYHVAIIGSWHFNKAGKTDVLEMVNGSIGLPAVSINRIGLVREPDAVEARLKAHCKRGAEADWMLSFDVVTCQWALLGDTRDVKASNERKQVLTFLEEQGQATFKQLLEVTEMPYNNLIQLIQSMRKDEQIKRVAKGEYALIAQHDRDSTNMIDTPESGSCFLEHPDAAHKKHDRHDRHDRHREGDHMNNRDHVDHVRDSGHPDGSKNMIVPGSCTDHVDHVFSGISLLDVCTAANVPDEVLSDTYFLPAMRQAVAALAQGDNREARRIAHADVRGSHRRYAQVVIDTLSQRLTSGEFR